MSFIGPALATHGAAALTVEHMQPAQCAVVSPETGDTKQKGGTV
jgi:hypothetical protein